MPISGEQEKPGQQQNRMVPFGKVRAQQEPDCGVSRAVPSQASPGTVLATELNLLGKYLGKSRAGTKPTRVAVPEAHQLDAAINPQQKHDLCPQISNIKIFWRKSSERHRGSRDISLSNKASADAL